MSKGKFRQDPVLLDTHIWIWLVSGHDRLKEKSFLDLIEAAARDAILFVSVISIWEVGMLVSKGRITLAGHCLDWVKKAVQIPGMHVVSLTPEIAVESTMLPGEFRGDSADRILIATAKSLGAMLVTCDRPMIDYLKKNHLPVIEP